MEEIIHCNTDFMIFPFHWIVLANEEIRYCLNSSVPTGHIPSYWWFITTYKIVIAILKRIHSSELKLTR